MPFFLLAAAASPDYRHQLDAAKADPAATDWTALRAAYAAGPTYDPFAGSTPEDAAASAAMARNNPRLATQLADRSLLRNWMNLRAQLLDAAAYRQLNDAPQATLHQETAAGIIGAILATGTGGTADRPIHVLSTSEEYVVLQTMHLHSMGQRLTQQNGHWLDILSAVHQPDRKSVEIYFNVDLSYAREGAVAMGTLKPLADGDVR